MTAVVPMKLVPVSMNVSSPISTISSSAINTDSEFPTITESQVSFRKKQNTAENLTNLDSELLSILHNKDLSDDAKAKLYWIALHKSEIYKDKSMWSEPTIVELRENRFIPIPMPITAKPSDIPKVGTKRKLIEELEPDRSTSKRMRTDVGPIQPVVPTPSRKRRFEPEVESEQENDRELKRMALVNRIQNGQISQEEVERQQDLIENPPQRQITSQIPEILSGPLVVVDQQDEDQPQRRSYTPEPLIQPSPPRRRSYTPEPLSFSPNLLELTQPQWLQDFYRKMKIKIKNIPRQNLIISLVDRIVGKDPDFKITNTNIHTSRHMDIKGDPVAIFSSVVTGKTTRGISPLLEYLKDLRVEFQTGFGRLKNFKIKKWVKL